MAKETPSWNIQMITMMVMMMIAAKLLATQQGDLSPASSSRRPSGEQYPMTTMSGGHRERGGTAETSFIERVPSGGVSNSDTSRIELANLALQEKYPEYGKDGKVLTLEVSKGIVVVKGPRGGETLLFKADGKTINPKYQKQP